MRPTEAADLRRIITDLGNIRATGETLVALNDLYERLCQLCRHSA